MDHGSIFQNNIVNGINFILIATVHEVSACWWTKKDHVLFKIFYVSAAKGFELKVTFAFINI